MAQTSLVEIADRIIHSIKRMNEQALQMQTGVSKIRLYLATLSAPDKAELFSVLTDRGYDLSELNAFITELEGLETYVGANITKYPEGDF